MKIKYEVEDLCVGCPQGCRHCGRSKVTIPVAIECDMCGQDCEEVYKTEDGDVCEDCLKSCYHLTTVDDIAEDVGAYFDEDWIERK